MFLPLVVDWFQKAIPCYEAIFQGIPRADILQAIDMVELHGFFSEGPYAYQSRQLSAIYKFVRNMPMLAIGKEEED